MTRILKPVDDLVWSVEWLEAPPPARLVEQLNLTPAGPRKPARRVPRPAPGGMPVAPEAVADRASGPSASAAPPAIRDRIFNDDLRQAAAAVLEHPPRKPAETPAETPARPGPVAPAETPASASAPTIPPAPVAPRPSNPAASAAREPAGLLDDPLFHATEAGGDPEDLRGEFLGEILAESDLNIEGDIERVRQDSFPLQPEAHSADAVQSDDALEAPSGAGVPGGDDLLLDLLPSDDELGELALSSSVAAPVPRAEPAQAVATAPRVPLDFDPLQERPMSGGDPALHAALNALYAVGALHEDDFRPALDYLLGLGGADSAALLYFEPEAQSYRPLLARNLDADTLRNFAIGVADTYINARREMQIIRLDDALKRDRQFRKRFSIQFFEDHAALVVFNLRAVGADGFLALGYRKSPGEDRTRLMETLTRGMLDLAPLFERYRMHRWARRVVSNEDSIMVSEAVEALKLVSRNGGFTVHTVHVRFPELLERDDWRARIETLARRASLELGPDERLFINGPDRLLAVLHPEHATAFRACVELEASAMQLSALIGGGVYPDEGKNFYNYIALPPELTPGRESAAP